MYYQLNESHWTGFENLQKNDFLSCSIFKLIFWNSPTTGCKNLWTKNYQFWIFWAWPRLRFKHIFGTILIFYEIYKNLLNWNLEITESIKKIMDLTFLISFGVFACFKIKLINNLLGTIDSIPKPKPVPLKNSLKNKLRKHVLRFFEHPEDTISIS